MINSCIHLEFLWETFVKKNSFTLDTIETEKKTLTFQTKVQKVIEA